MVQALSKASDFLIRAQCKSYGLAPSSTRVAKGDLVVVAGDPPRGQLAGSWLAHAELNALTQIDAQ